MDNNRQAKYSIFHSIDRGQEPFPAAGKPAIKSVRDERLELFGRSPTQDELRTRIANYGGLSGRLE
jgi:hypothetical protein